MTKPSAEILLANFQTAISAIAAAQIAHDEAVNTEARLVERLHAETSLAYLNPSVLRPDSIDQISKESLNAHVVKVQADQIQLMSQHQLKELQQSVHTDFVGRKIAVDCIDNMRQIDAVWFNQLTGYRSSRTKKRSIKGKIIDVLLAENVIVVQPSLFERTVNRELIAYYIYALNPTTLQPAVSASIA